MIQSKRIKSKRAALKLVWPRRFIPTQEQISYLKDHDQLKALAGKSLAERVALFNRKFGAKIISIYKLRRIYKELGIKLNKLRLTKVMDD